MELYYYTTTDTLRFILEKGDIYATNIRYMNDSEEYINGLEGLWQLVADNGELVKEWLRQRQYDNITYKELESRFVKSKLEQVKRDIEFYSISFCQKNDLLSQWAIYARESGVSIKMNFDRDSYAFLTESTEAADKTEQKIYARWRAIPEKVWYFTYNAAPGGQENYRNNAFDILDRLYQKGGSADGMLEFWQYISTFIKRYDFYQEAESRLIFQRGDSAYPPKVQYRCDKKVLKPYLDIECEGGWPIWEIMVGPGFNQEVVYNSVIHFLDNSIVKNGITNTREYLQRIRGYFGPCMKNGKVCQRISDYFDSISDDELKKMELSEARIALYSKVSEICKFIRDDECEKEYKDYVASHRFTESGIVVTKSSIPYLF